MPVFIKIGRCYFNEAYLEGGGRYVKRTGLETPIELSGEDAEVLRRYVEAHSRTWHSRLPDPPREEAGSD